MHLRSADTRGLGWDAEAGVLLAADGRWRAMFAIDASSGDRVIVSK